MPGGPLDDATWHRCLYRVPGMAIDRVAKLGRLAETPCEMVMLRLRMPLEVGALFLAAVRSRTNQLEAQIRTARREGLTLEPGSSPSLAAAWTFSTRSPYVPEWAGLLALIEEFVSTWDDPRGAVRHENDETYSEAGWRCMAPGCTSRENLEAHHIIYRSRLGPDDLWNLLCLCRMHHKQGEHGELASCRGRAPLGVVWWLGRGGIGGKWKNERRLSEPAPLGSPPARPVLRRPDQAGSSSASREMPYCSSFL